MILKIPISSTPKRSMIFCSSCLTHNIKPVLCFCSFFQICQNHKHPFKTLTGLLNEPGRRFKACSLLIRGHGQLGGNQPWLRTSQEVNLWLLECRTLTQNSVGGFQFILGAGMLTEQMLSDKGDNYQSKALVLVHLLWLLFSLFCSK